MATNLPRHVAVVMDGNGRWALSRGLPRHEGHRAGIKPVRSMIEESARLGVEALTLFAFSSENWSRPAQEVGTLMTLFLEALDREVDELHGNGVRLRFIGDRGSLAERLQARIAASEQRTRDNAGLKLQIAVSYGGRWDLMNAARTLAARCERGERRAPDLTEEDLASQLQLAGLPDPDLFIRTGGERRISNFLLWNLAYTELYFTATLWPDFDAAAYGEALGYFASRERRFGLTGEQSAVAGNAAEC